MAQKYVVVHFIDIANVPAEFPSSAWPLHVTLLANFTLGEPLEQLQKDLARYAQQIEPFTIPAEGEALFEPAKSVAVSLIQPKAKIMAIHNQLAAIATQLGAVYDEPAYMGEGFIPHATIQAESRLAEGQTAELSHFTLVDMFPGDDIYRRKIIETYQFGINQKPQT